MKSAIVLSGLILVLGVVEAPFVSRPAQALRPYTIKDNPGGDMVVFTDALIRLRDSGRPVVVNGRCDSACTMVLGIVPLQRICVTPNAVFGFHEASDWWKSENYGVRHPSPEGTAYLWALYPPQVRRWITAHGGLTPNIKSMGFPDTLNVAKRC